MALKIVGAGFGRTGTASLEKLGFGPCYHMSEVLARPEHVGLYRSTQETIFGPRWWDFVLSGPFGAMCKATIGTFLNGDVHGHDHMIAAFNRHIEQVMAAVPPEKLLVFEARDGWAPLCSFLGVPVPDEPFPHVNSEAETQALFDSIIAANAADQIGGRAIEDANEAFSATPA